MRTFTNILFQSLNFAGIFFILLVKGQIQRFGRYSSEARQLFLNKSAYNAAKLTIKVPFHDSKVLLAAEKALHSASKFQPRPITFAKAIPLNIDTRTMGVWLNDTKLGLNTWSIYIQSKTAFALALIFDHFIIPSQGELYVLNEQGTLGAFTSENNKPDAKFSIQPVKGENLFLVYIEPSKAIDHLDFLKIGKVVHAFRDIYRLSMNGKSVSGSCNVDVSCVNAFNNQKRATIILMTDQLQKFCTGAMINNARGDGKQLLLTANHCVFTDLSNSITGFNYQKLACGTNAMISNPQTAHGMKLLARGSTSDFALFEVVEMIPKSYNVFLSGWDARAPDISIQSVFAGIHHPSGDVKKISLYDGKLQVSSWAEAPNRFHIVVPRWTSGVTEPGSSGSPLFNSAGLIIGQLHGGASSCSDVSGADLYGGFAYSFGENGSGVSLKQFLDPDQVINNLILPGRNLYSSSPVTVTTSSFIKPSATTFTVTRIITTTTTSTVTLNNCPCIQRIIVEKLLKSYENRIKSLESKKKN